MSQLSLSPAEVSTFALHGTVLSGQATTCYHLPGCQNSGAHLAASSLRGKGLNLGVATMRKGERCRLGIAPEYGYGAKGGLDKYARSSSWLQGHRPSLLIVTATLHTAHTSVQSIGACTGSFSFPAVPPDAHLEYEVQLVDWEPAGEEPPREQML
jgi:FKBP-type peptidyl-prolyl cis-trans isomerase